MDGFLNSSFLIALGSWLGVSYGIHRIFEKAEDVLNAETKQSVTRWLKNLKTPESLGGWPRTFAETFDAVFGKKHLAWKCFWRSCLASAISFTLMFLIWAAVRWSELSAFEFEARYLFNALLVLLLLNLIPDYLSLLETRLVIKWMSSTQSFFKHVLLLLTDAVITGLIAIVIIPIFIKTGLYGSIWDMLFVPDQSFVSLISVYFEEVLPLTSQSLIWVDVFRSEPFPFFSISFYTAFFTSVWIWLYAVSGLAVKLLLKLNFTFRFIRKRFNVDEKPVSTLGFMAMMLVTIFYLAVAIMPDFGKAEDKTPHASVPLLRSEPTTISEVSAFTEMLRNKGFYDRLWNPRGAGVENKFKFIEREGAQLIVDEAVNLTWQQGGSTERMTFVQAQAYIDSLNQAEFAGFDDWRLPTLEEAMSLMEPEPNEHGLYINPLFEQAQSWIWTADKRAASDVWVVGFDLGYCGSDLVDFSVFVRAVRSGQSLAI